MPKLQTKTCTPCQSKTPKLNAMEISTLLEEVPGYTLLDVNGVEQISKEYPFKNFKEALQFTNMVAEIAEEENHHPQIILEWGKVTVSWWTHSVEGLHTNDFIMAAKTDRIK